MCEGVGNCGSDAAPLFFLSFQILGQYVLLNLFVAVLIEFYDRQQVNLHCSDTPSTLSLIFLCVDLSGITDAATHAH
jgi:hypothetical protein